MKWEGREQSTNVEDRRGRRGPMMVGGGGIAVILVMLLLKFLNAPQPLQQMAGQVVQQMQQNARQAPDAGGEGIDDESKAFISVVLRDTETVWTKLFQEQVADAAYVPPKLVIFGGSVQSGCGIAGAEMGPFYCPADQQVYIDPVFFDELGQRFQAPGDFAQAYVIAHEVSHHVQKLIGYSDLVSEERAKGDERHSNEMSVRLELQADFLAGVWAHHAHREYGILEDGDMEEAITAANQIGDDKLQREATGRVIPERFTHGTSAQRVKWFKRGFVSGKLADCKELFTTAYERL